MPTAQAELPSACFTGDVMEYGCPPGKQDAFQRARRDLSVPAKATHWGGGNVEGMHSHAGDLGKDRRRRRRRRRPPKARPDRAGQVDGRYRRVESVTR